MMRFFTILYIYITVTSAVHAQTDTLQTTFKIPGDGEFMRERGDYFFFSTFKLNYKQPYVLIPFLEYENGVKNGVLTITRNGTIQKVELGKEMTSTDYRPIENIYGFNDCLLLDLSYECFLIDMKSSRVLHHFRGLDHKDVYIVEDRFLVIIDKGHFSSVGPYLSPLTPIEYYGDNGNYKCLGLNIERERTSGWEYRVYFYDIDEKKELLYVDNAFEYTFFSNMFYDETLKDWFYLISFRPIDYELLNIYIKN